MLYEIGYQCPDCGGYLWHTMQNLTSEGHCCSGCGSVYTLEELEEIWEGKPMSEIYYEVAGDHEIRAFEIFEDAAAYADEIGSKTIYEIGGSFDEYEKCWFCGEWFTTGELDEDDLCDSCAVAVRDHGG